MGGLAMERVVVPVDHWRAQTIDDSFPGRKGFHRLESEN
jgi:hypothetical protein